MQVSRGVGHMSVENLLEVGTTVPCHRQHSQAAVQARHSRRPDEQQQWAPVTAKADEEHQETEAESHSTADE